jgi:hypothetical protein
MTDSEVYAAGFKNPVTARLAAFIASIGVPVIAGHVAEKCFVPGIRLERGTLLVDESCLLYPGDLLHEAGHIAVMTPARRQARVADASSNMGDEIAAIAWSWAALTFLGIAPEIVFHPQGYKGASAWFIETYGAGTYIGLPLLQWMGLTLDPANAAKAGVAPFPHMLRWLREEPA